jgi:hypothetical protein
MRTKKQPKNQKISQKPVKSTLFAYPTEPTPKEPSPVTTVLINTYKNPTGFCDHSSFSMVTKSGWIFVC